MIFIYYCNLVVIRIKCSGPYSDILTFILSISTFCVPPRCTVSIKHEIKMSSIYLITLSSRAISTCTNIHVFQKPPLKYFAVNQLKRNINRVSTYKRLRDSRPANVSGWMHWILFALMSLNKHMHQMFTPGNCPFFSPPSRLVGVGGRTDNVNMTK